MSSILKPELIMAQIVEKDSSRSPQGITRTIISFLDRLVAYSIRSRQAGMIIVMANTKAIAKAGCLRQGKDQHTPYV